MSIAWVFDFVSLQKKKRNPNPHLADFEFCWIRFFIIFQLLQNFMEPRGQRLHLQSDNEISCLDVFDALQVLILLGTKFVVLTSKIIFVIYHTLFCVISQNMACEAFSVVPSTW